jgi:RNase P subunit RPR2
MANTMEKYTKWEHIMFVEDFRAGIKTYEIVRRIHIKTGLPQWKRIYVKQCCHRLWANLTTSFAAKTQQR